VESEKNVQEVGIIWVIIYINLAPWKAENPPQNFMIEHLLLYLYGVDSHAVKYIANVKNL